MSSSIFLLGFMGSGKSFLGKRLAEELSYDFLDTDEWIEEKVGKTISEIFEKDGEAAFRELERSAILEIKNKTNIVVATGGGLPCHHQNIDLLIGSGQTIYLKANINLLSRRLKNERMHRPLLQSLSDSELNIFIEKKLSEREKFYTQSAIIFYLTNDEAGNLTHFLSFFS